jgi:biotin transport system substrate-specific component
MNTAAVPLASPRVLADLVAPRAYARDVLLVSAGALLTALCAQIVIPIRGDPVPITGQTFAVLLSGAALGSTRGAAAMGLYLALGLVGLPVYSDQGSGLEVIAGATGGYLIGFPIAAWVVGRLAERRMDRSPWKALPVFTVGSLIVFATGEPWLAVAADLSLAEAISLGLLPFIPGGIVKAVAAAGLLPAAWKLAGPRRS